MPTIHRYAFVGAAALAALALTGCVTMTEPVNVGADTYMIGLNARGGLTGDAELLAQTMRAAGAFCGRQGRQMELQSSNTSGMQGWSPQGNQVVFKCAVRSHLRVPGTHWEATDASAGSEAAAKP